MTDRNEFVAIVHESGPNRHAEASAGSAAAEASAGPPAVGGGVVAR